MWLPAQDAENDDDDDDDDDDGDDTMKINVILVN